MLMAFLTTNRGLKWHYETCGQGDAVLLIHGFAGSGHWWKAQQEALEKYHQVITIDLPGHGQSGWMPVTLAEMAIDLRQVLRAAGATQITVVASSFGGLIALELYRLMSSDIMRMSFVGSMPKFARGPQYPAGLDIDRIRTLSGQFDGNYVSILDIFFRSLFTMKERDSARFQEIKKMRAEEMLPQRDALKHFLDMMEKTDLRDRLSSVICPLQFISGREDYICPPAIMGWIGEHAYNARIDIMEGCGHLPFLTDVKEYNRLLEDFFIH